MQLDIVSLTNIIAKMDQLVLIVALDLPLLPYYLQVLDMILLDLPGLLFFSTYTLLVLFWAEIYHQVFSIL